MLVASIIRIIGVRGRKDVYVSCMTISNLVFGNNLRCMEPECHCHVHMLQPLTSLDPSRFEVLRA